LARLAIPELNTKIKCILFMYNVSQRQERAAIRKTSRWMTHREKSANCRNHKKTSKHSVGNTQFSQLNLAVYALTSTL
jgi:hypothetical protein